MNTKITFVELVDLLSESTSTTSRVCELFLRELFNTISQTLIKGRPVTVKGIGEFKVVESTTREASKASAHKRISFTPDKHLAEALNEPFAQFKTIILDDAVTDEQLAEIDAQFPSTVVTPIPEIDEQQPKAEETVTPAEPVPAVETIAPETKQELKSEPVVEHKPEPEPVVEHKPEPEPKSNIGPALAKSVEHKPVERKPMLIGIPIDGPSQPVPEPEPEEEETVNKRFYRPEPRNVYTPTPEQIEEANRKPDRRWWLPALGLLAVAAILWWAISDAHHDTNGITSEEHVAVAADTLSDSDTVGLALVKTDEQKDIEKAVKEEIAKKPADDDKPVAISATQPAPKKEQVTDVVTSQIVLTTLAEKHYGSPWFWVYIYEENKSIISNPNNIKPGTRVVIPPPEKYGINPKDKASLKKAQVKSWQYLKGK